MCYKSQFKSSENQVCIKSNCHLFSTSEHVNFHTPFGESVDRLSSVDLLVRLSVMEGAVRTLLAMNNLGVGVEPQNPSSVQENLAPLSRNEIILLGFAMTFGRIFNYKNPYAKANKNVFNLIVEILETCNSAFSEQRENLFLKHFFRSANVSSYEQLALKLMIRS